MKKLLLSLLVAACSVIAQAHEHIQVGIDPENPAGLVMSTEDPDNPNLIATWFPLGESPSTYLPQFPGGTFASEVSFSVEGDVFAVPIPATVHIEILAITGPAGSAFSFWDVAVNPTTPLWTQPAGWTAAGADQFSFVTNRGGTGHLHGRAFTMNRPGVYAVTFRAVDTYVSEPPEPPHVQFTPSAPYTVYFTAVVPPQLAISKLDTDIKLTFTSRPDLSYDVQSSTTLDVNDWTTIDTLDGTGGLLEFIEPIADRPRAFYRLVEYP